MLGEKLHADRMEVFVIPLYAGGRGCAKILRGPCGLCDSRYRWLHLRSCAPWTMFWLFPVAMHGGVAWKVKQLGAANLRQCQAFSCIQTAETSRDPSLPHMGGFKIVHPHPLLTCLKEPEERRDPRPSYHIYQYHHSISSSLTSQRPVSPHLKISPLFSAFRPASPLPHWWAIAGPVLSS